MYLAELKFKVIADTDFDQAEAAIRRYMEALIFNGQLLGREFPTAWQQDCFVSRIVLPATEALKQQYHSPRGLAALQQLATAGLGYPQLNVLGMDLMSNHTIPAHLHLITFCTVALTIPARRYAVANTLHRYHCICYLPPAATMKR